MYNIVEPLVLVASLLLCALASPVHEDLSSRMVVPPEAYRVALDEDNARLLAFDGEGKNLGYYHANAVLPMKKKRDESQLSCVPMNDGEIAGLPGINELRDYADLHFSPAARREVVNDDHGNTRNLEAMVCTSDDGVKLHYDDKPTCTTVKSNATGSMSDGFMMTTINGVAYLESVSTIVKQSKFSHGGDFSTKVSIEGVDIDIGHSYGIAFMNKLGHANRIRQEVSTQQTIRQLSKHDLQCVLTVVKKHCVLTGSADVWLVATGWLWFQYHRPVGTGEGDRHHKWAVNMDHILPDEHQRGSMIQFRTSGDMQAKTEFHGDGCTDDMFEIIMPSQSASFVSVPPSMTKREELPRAT